MAKFCFAICVSLVAVAATRADSITILKASVVKKSIYANGKFVATDIVSLAWEVSADQKTWTQVQAMNEKIDPVGKTWQGNTADLADGTYWLRIKMNLLNNKFEYSNIWKTDPVLKVPGPETCRPEPFDEENSEFEPLTVDWDCREYLSHGREVKTRTR